MIKRISFKSGYFAFAVVCMITVMRINILAGETEKLSVRDYVIQELQDYLGGFGYDNADDIKVSQKYTIQNTEDRSIFFVSVNGEQIGAVTVTEDHGGNNATFLYGDFEDIVPDDKEIAVQSNGDGISILYDGVEKIVSGKGAGKTVASHDNNIKAKKLKYKDESKNINIETEKFEGTINESLITNDYNAGNVAVGASYKTAAQISSLSSKVMYYMNPVSFRQNYNINGGICWAAAGASIIDYKLNASYTTMNVYNALSSYYGGTPVGSVEWMQRMWAYYGVPMTLVEHRLSFNTIVQKLGSKCPIMCNFFYSPDGVSLTIGHSVVLCGCYYKTDLQKYYYVYMDPNYASSSVYVVNHIPEYVLNSEVGTGFYYNDGNGLILNNWVSAFY